MIKIPTNGKWLQTNKSDSFGSLVGSFNLDVTTNLGATRTNRMIQTASQSTVTTMTGYPVGFKYFNASGSPAIYTVAGTRVHISVGAVPFAGWSVETSTGFPTTCDSTESDIEVFNGSLYVTTFSGSGDKIYKLSGTTWTANGTTLGAQTGTHMLTVYGGKMFISRGSSSIYSLNTSDTVATDVLSLGSEYVVTCMRPASNRVWICTLSKGRKGYVFEWDGAATQVTRGYRLEGQGALACVIKDDVPWIVDTSGRLLVYSNGTFVEKGRLPLDNRLLAVATNSANTRFIHPNGMTVVNGRVNLLINNLLGDNAGSTPEFCPSGVWEFDEEFGLYHKMSPSYLPVNTNTITDYGQVRLSGVGALSEMKLESTATNNTGSLLVGATVYTNASTTDVGVFTDDTFEATTGLYHATQSFGYLVTTKIASQSIKDMFNKVWVMHEKFKTASDKIIVKYRTTQDPPTEVSITWINTTTFYTATDVSAYLVGDEVEITQGTGSGLCAHISSIQAGSSSYIVALDETFTGVTTGTAKARFQKWKKAGVVQDSDTFDESSINIPANWIQLKIGMLFIGKNELNEVNLVNTPFQKYE